VHLANPKHVLGIDLPEGLNPPILGPSQSTGSQFFVVTSGELIRLQTVRAALSASDISELLRNVGARANQAQGRFVCNAFFVSALEPPNDFLRLAHGMHPGYRGLFMERDKRRSMSGLGPA